jgi:hypothetical protein
MSRKAKDDRYNHSEKVRERRRRYNVSEKGQLRNERYEQTAKALRRRVDSDRRRGREPYLQEAALEEGEAYEAFGSDLPFGEWLQTERPLRRCPRWTDHETDHIPLSTEDCYGGSGLNRLG